MKNDDIKLDRDMIRDELKLIKSRLRDITGIDSDNTQELISEVSKLRGIKDRMRRKNDAIVLLTSENTALKSRLDTEKTLDRTLNDRLYEKSVKK